MYQTAVCKQTFVTHEIWAYGLRQPWPFDFDPLSGDLEIADIGEQEQEEVNYMPAGHLPLLG